MSRQISKKSDGKKRQGEGIRRKVCANGQAGAAEIRRKVCANGQVWCSGNKAESLHERAGWGSGNKTESLCKRAGRGSRNKTESLCKRAGRGRKRPKKNAGNRRYRETIRSVFGFSRGGEDFIAFLFQGGLAEVGFFGKIFAEFGTDVFDFFFEGAEFVFQKQFINVFAQVIDERGAFFEHIKFPKRGQRGAFGALRQLLLQFIGSRGRFGFAVQIRHGGEKVFQAGISNVRGENLFFIFVNQFGVDQTGGDDETQVFVAFAVGALAQGFRCGGNAVAECGAQGSGVCPARGTASGIGE